MSDDIQPDQDRQVTEIFAPKYVVGIGASAGGLEALEQFFAAAPSSNEMAYVVVQHLSPDFKSVMDDLLARVTELPIHVIEDGMKIEGGSIYLLPPNQEIICSSGKLLLTDRSAGRELSFPIDQFFRSLADDAGSRAIAVVLSGTGTDGSRGICHVHEAGGLVIAQSVESAKFNGMPKAAVDTGVVDLTLAARDIPDVIENYAGNPELLSRLKCKAELLAMEGPMYTVFHLLKRHCGVDFADYKTSTIGRRVHRRVILAGLPDLEAYVDVLRENPAEVDRLYKDLLIGVTSFFRDREVFERLEIDVIPDLMQRLSPNEEFRAWVVGTATGEEAFSLAILIREYLDANEDSRPVKIFATDVHRDSLDAASRAVYQESSLIEMAPKRLERFFIRKADGYHVSPELRKMVVCVSHNMVRDAPFTKLDLVTCRNVLIYLSTAAQTKVLSIFHFALKRSGVLCLGPSETLGELTDEFSPLDERMKIYRKQRDVPLPASTRLPLAVPSIERKGGSSSSPLVTNIGKPKQQRDAYLVYDSLLNEFLPPSLLIGPDHQLLHTFKGGNRFLRQPEGRVSNDILDLVHGDVRATLSTALRRVRDKRKPVTFQGVKCKLNGQNADVQLSVRPIGDQAVGEEPEVLISFEVQQERSEEEASLEVIDARDISSEEVFALERELQDTRDNLHATIEQLQTTNEEMQSTNEQLIASNEELQSTNEELHSVNEELYTVNAEHQRKIDELTELTDDMDNLLGSTNVHTMFLDSEMRIRRFTPGIADTFNLIAQDVGRRIDTFTYNILDKDLVLEIKHVLETEAPFEREVRDRSDRHYLMRILPYLAAGQVDGAVLTLIDITTLKAAEHKLAEVSEIVEHSNDAIMRLSTDEIVTTWNAGAEKLFGFSRDEVIGRRASILVPAEQQEESQAVFRKAIEGESVDRFETSRICKDGQVIDVSLTLSPIRNEQGAVVGASEIVRDVTAQKQAENEVQAAVRNRDQFLAMLSHELRNPMAAVLNATTLQREGGIDKETEIEARNVIERNVRHVARLLDDLLDLSRFTHDKISLHRQVVDLSSLVMDATECVQPMIDEKGHQLHVSADSEPIYVEGDVGRIQQAQVNLLVNAAKYTGPGGRIEYSLNRENNEAVIRVSDDGIGIADGFLKDVFQPFTQSDQSLDRSQGGMGLGLPLVRMIVEAHGGSIVAHSDGASKGSQFTIRLPLTEKRPEKKPSISPTLADGKRLVIVEDNSGIRKMLAASMRLKGFEVATASDGNEGLDTIVEFNPDVAIIDIGLPDVNGYQLATMIREKPEFRELLLVAVTGYGRDADRKAAMKAGFDLHLVKPLDPNEVLSAITGHLADINRSPGIAQPT